MAREGSEVIKKDFFRQVGRREEGGSKENVRSGFGIGHSRPGGIQSKEIEESERLGVQGGDARLRLKRGK